MDWSGSSFVATPGDVPVTLVPDYVTTLFFQVGSGVGPPGAPIDYPKIDQLQALGKACEAWVWCAGPTQPGGGQPEEEAEAHAARARGFGASVLVVNMESYYDAGGNQNDIRYHYPSRYLDALDWSGPLGLTTTATFGSDMTAWRERGAIYMPQAFTAENGATIEQCLEHGEDWGWPFQSQRPLIQTYPSEKPDGTVVWPDWQDYKLDANNYNVGVSPFVQERAEVGFLSRLQSQIMRPTLGGGAMPGTLIGKDDGIAASMNRLRNLDPQGTLLRKNADGSWPALSTLGSFNASTWKAYDKLQRTLQIMKDDHDAEVS